jgi:hypothetical protein
MLAKQYSDQAAAYEKMADNARASQEQRMLFAKKANWFRILARLATDNEEKERAGELLADAPFVFDHSGCTSVHLWKASLLVFAALFSVAIVLWAWASSSL